MVKRTHLLNQVDIFWHQCGLKEKEAQFHVNTYPVQLGVHQPMCDAVLIILEQLKMEMQKW